MNQKKKILFKTIFLCFVFLNSSNFKYVHSFSTTSPKTYIDSLELVYGLESYVLNENGTIIVDTIENENNSLLRIIQTRDYNSLLELSSCKFEFNRYNQTYFKVDIDIISFNYSWSGFLYYNENEGYFSSELLHFPMYCPLIIDFDQIKTTKPFATSIRENYIELFESGDYIKIGEALSIDDPTPFISQSVNQREVKVYQDINHNYFVTSLFYEEETGILLSGRLPGNCFGSLLQTLMGNHTCYVSNPNLFLVSSSVSFKSPISGSSIFQIILFVGLFLGIPLGFTLYYIKNKRKKK